MPGVVGRGGPLMRFDVGDELMKRRHLRCTQVVRHVGRHSVDAWALVPEETAGRRGSPNNIFLEQVLQLIGRETPALVRAAGAVIVDFVPVATDRFNLALGPRRIEVKSPSNGFVMCGIDVGAVSEAFGGFDQIFGRLAVPRVRW